MTAGYAEQAKALATESLRDAGRRVLCVCRRTLLRIPDSPLCALAFDARLAAGETLLVLGAAGGVGLAAVEVGKALGAKVIAAAGGPEKTAAATAHGADAVIDYRSEDLRARAIELSGRVVLMWSSIRSPVITMSHRSGR